MHFLNVFVIGLDTYSSRFRDMFLVVGILRIQMRSLESVYGVSMFSEVLTKSLKFYWQSALFADQYLSFSYVILSTSVIYFLIPSRRYLGTSEWLLLYLALLIYICFYEDNFVFFKGIFKKALLLCIYCFIKVLFSFYSNALWDYWEMIFKRTLNILLCLYFSHQGHCSLLESMTDKL